MIHAIEHQMTISQICGFGPVASGCMHRNRNRTHKYWFIPGLSMFVVHEVLEICVCKIFQQKCSGGCVSVPIQPQRGKLPGSPPRQLRVTHRPSSCSCAMYMEYMLTIGYICGSVTQTTIHSA